jgi:hemerythrin-like domain-containing protein
MIMTENEIFLKGIVIGASAIIPFIGILLGKWHHWKAEYMFSKMMHDDAMAQNERLFRAVKSAEDKAKYFESKLKFVIEQYKPIVPINKPTDNNKNNAIELLKPRIMKNGCEYYLAGEVRLCIEQAARQITESNSVYKELDSIINHQKYKRCLAMAQEWRNYAAFCGMQQGIRVLFRN